MNALIEMNLLKVLHKAERMLDLGIKVLETKVDDIERRKAYEEMSKVPSRDAESN